MDVIGYAELLGRAFHELLQLAHLALLIGHEDGSLRCLFADAEDGQVVALLCAVGEFLHFFVQCIHDFTGRKTAHFLHDADEPLLAELVALPVFGFGESVGIDQQLGSYGEVHAVALEVEAFHNSQRDIAFGLQQTATTIG